MTGTPRTPAAPARMPVVLMLAGFYPPAYLAGGPTRSLPRIVDELKDEFDFRVVTRDRDLGAAAPLAGVVSDRWVDAGGARCLYLSGRRRLTGGLLTSIRGIRHDVLYLNSVFSLQFSLLPLLFRRLGLLPRRGLVMAPRGELDASALAIKARRKRLYLGLVRRLRLLHDATWHAATEAEAKAIQREFGLSARVWIARDIAALPGPDTDLPPKQPGSLQLVFLSRISRMKNLDFAISVLQRIRGLVTFNVYGPIEDEEYWAACRRLAEALPSNVTLHYRGSVEPHEVTNVLGRHHLFFLPTRAESFGHAIAESLSAGRPVLISDQTPWHSLEAAHAGWDLPLSQPDRFAGVIEQCVGMTRDELEAWSAGARRLGRQIADDPDLDDAYRAMFRAAVAGAGRPVGRLDAGH